LYETTRLYETTQLLLAQVEARQQAGGVDIIGQPTGFSDLDYALGGWRGDEMYSVAGKTGGGKSAFCLSTALHVARQDGVVVYFSLEMSAKLLALRSLSAMSGIPAMKIEKGQLTEQSLKLLFHHAKQFEKLPIYFYDRSITSLEIGDALTFHKDKHGLDMTVVDYIGLLKEQGKTPYEKVTQASINLRGHARDFDIPLIVVSQLNRASLNRESGRPMLQDLKESGQVENDSGAVIFPFRLPSDEDDNPDVEEAEIIVAKNRHGPIGTFAAEFLPRQMIWRPLGGVVVDPPRNERGKVHE
jgi:replicative DNA helicase